MKELRRSLVLCAVVLVLTTHQLPAPISEVESPTPTPQQSAKPKSRSSPKSKARSEVKPSATASTTPQSAKQSRFAGTWVGTMPEVPWSNVATELIVDQTETTITWQESGRLKGVGKTRVDGSTLQATFSVGVQEIWSLTPEPDGKTAQVRLEAFMNNQTAVFHRVAE